MDELRRIIEDSEVLKRSKYQKGNYPLAHFCVQIMAEDDELWPQPDRVGRQVNYCLIELFLSATSLTITSRSLRL